jgi:hypothetical protein
MIEVNGVKYDTIEDATPVLYKVLVETYGEADVYTTSELTEKYKVLGFSAPFVVVERREDGAKGSLEFTHLPRFYFGWRAH